jgi:hypothetical protein
MVDTASRTTPIRSHADTARSAFARPGLVGRGLFYLLFGLLAMDLAVGTSDSSQGAVEQVASAPLGRFLLIGLTAALVSLVAWKVLQAIAGDPVEGSEATDRAKYALKAMAYAGLAATSVSVLIANWGSNSATSGSSGSSSGSSETEQQATATVLDWPAGQWLVIIGGLAIVAFALYEAYEYALQAEFMRRIDTASLDHRARDGVEWSGRAGYAGKSAITAVVGIFLVVAGIRHDPDETEGLSGALRSLADSGQGTVLLVAVGIGLFLFAAFSFVEAAHRRTT